jgi:hypothetical protein
MRDPFSDAPDEFVATARAVLRSTDGADPLATLGWTDLLPHLDDIDARRAIFALFRAQGYELVSTGAIGLLMATPYLSAGMDVPSFTVGIDRSSERRGRRTVVVAGPVEGHLLVDRPGCGAWMIEVSASDFRSVDIPGRLALHELESDAFDRSVSIPEHIAADLRGRSYHLGRVGLAFDMLGAAEAALQLTTVYARDREQFGQPIGRFQAVRHLLALARTDCAAIAAVAGLAADLDGVLPARYDMVTKAVAGRNTRRVCQRTLQVLGAIGFTTEHVHHHYYGRVLGLDALLGTSAALAHDLASDWRSGRAPVPSLTAPMLTQAG